MKVLKYLVFLILVAIIGFSIYIAVQPNEYNFSRSRVIKAPSSLLFNKVNDFKNWPSFSPWIEKEPEAKLTYSETTSGLDANYAWNGEILGEGQMKTLGLEQNKSINQLIQFIKPFESESNINWFFENTEEGTKVTWNMSGKQDFITKLYTTFSGSIEDMTGPDFERGLFKLDSIVNADMNRYNIVVNGIKQHGGGYYLYNSSSCKMNELEGKIKEMKSKLVNYFKTNSMSAAGAPFTYYHKWDEENNAVILSYCLPTTEKATSYNSDILTGQLKPFKALKTTLTGDYKYIKKSWVTAMEYADKNGLENDTNGPRLETYRKSSNDSTNPADWITEIYMALK